MRTDKFYQLRLGFRQVKGLREDEMRLLIDGRKTTYNSVHQLRTIGLSEASLELLADADAFRSIGLDRREALWDASTQDKPLSLFDIKQSSRKEEGQIVLPQMSLSEHVVQDYATMALSLKAHPVSFIRNDLNSFNILSAEQLTQANDGDMVKVAGLILVRQRPGTASGICFITLEDETGTMNIVVFAKLFDEYRKEIIQSKLLMVEGRLQKEGQVIHVIVRRCFNFSRLLNKLATSDNDLSIVRSRSDETTAPLSRPSTNSHGKRDQSIQGEVFHKGRNFH